MKGFIELYEAYMKLKTDAPEVFAKYMAIQLLGHAMGKNWTNKIQPADVYHNVYSLLLAESTIGRKTSVQEFSSLLYPLKKQLPHDFSSEAFITNLSQIPSAILFYGEFSKILKSIKNPRSSNAVLVEIWNDLHTWRREKYVRSLQKCDYVIHNPYLSINSTLTPSVLYENVTKEMMEGGFLARFLLVFGKPNPRPRGKLPRNLCIIENHISYVFNCVLQISSKRKVSFELTDKALKRFNEIELELYKDKMILPFVGRYLEYIIAFADILYVSDMLYYDIDVNKLTILTDLTLLTELTKSNENKINKRIRVNLINAIKPVNNVNFRRSLTIDAVYIDRAYDIIKPCLDVAKRLLNYVSISKPVAKLRDFLIDNSPINRSQAMRYTHLDAEEMEIAENTLGAKGQDFLFIIIIKNPKGGKLTRVYCLRRNINTKKCVNCEWKMYCEEMI